MLRTIQSREEGADAPRRSAGAIIGRAVNFDELLAKGRTQFAGRGWLVDRVRSFIGAANAPLALVVLGEPGAGKTAVLAHLADRLSAAHFFFGRSDGLRVAEGGGWSEPLRCAETLLAQLQCRYGEDVYDAGRIGIDVELRAREADALVGAEIGTFNARPHRADRPAIRIDAEAGLRSGAMMTGVSIGVLRIDPVLAMQELVLEPLRRAAERTAGPVVIVLDALDEWDRIGCPRDLLELMYSSDLPANVRVIASARPSYASRLPSAWPTIDLVDSAAEAAVNEDMKSWLERAAAERRLALTPALRDAFIRRAGGNFLFATYLIALLEREDPADAIARQPPELDAFYRQELGELAKRLAREGMRGDLVPFLAVLCSAREPIGVSLLAKAAELPHDLAADLLTRIAAFVRRREVGGEARYAPFHLSLADAVLKGKAGLAIAPGDGHRRLAEALRLPSWAEASDYAVHHAVAHAASSGLEAAARTRDLIDNPGYLVARAERVGIDALDGDLRYARAVGAEPPHLAAIVAELALRAEAQREARVSAAQGLSMAAGVVGAGKLVDGFSALVTAPVRVVPAWRAGFEGARAATGGFRGPRKVRHAVLAANGILTLLGETQVELWDVTRRFRLAAAAVGEDVRYASAEADGARIWLVAHCTQGGSRLLRIDQRGAVLDEMAFDHRLSAIRVSDCGAWLAVANHAGRIFLLDAAAGAIVGRADVGGQIVALAFDGDRLAALTRARKLVVWRVPRLALDAWAVLPVAGRVAHIDESFGLALSDRFAVVGCVDGAVIRVGLDKDGDGLQARIATLGGWADALALADGRLVAGDSAGRLHVIDPDVAAPTTAMRAHAEAILAVGAAGEADMIVSVAADGEVMCWRMPRRAETSTPAHAAAVLDLVCGESGVLLSLGSDGSLVEWREDGAVAQRGYLDPRAFGDARLTRDRTGIVYAMGNLLHRRPLNAAPELLSAVPWPPLIQDKCTNLFTGTADPIPLSDDGELAARPGGQGVELWAFDPDRILVREQGKAPAGRGALSGDGDLLVTSGDERLWLRELNGEDPARELPEGRTLLCAPFWTPEGRRLLTATGDRLFCISAEDLAVTASWTEEAGEPDFAAVSPDGSLIATVSGGTITFRSPAGARRGVCVTRPAVSAAEFSPDGRRLAVGDRGGGIQMLRVERGCDDT